MAAETKVGRWTSVPAGWSGMRLYDWERGGLRSQGNVYVPSPVGRARKTFAWRGSIEITTLPVGGDRRLLLRVRALAPGEVWPVYRRRGMFWAREYYLVPTMALRDAQAALAPTAKAPSPNKSGLGDLAVAAG